jgi:hypothetical protein
MQVAPVCHLKQNRTGKLFMGFTESTVKGASLFNSPIAEIRMDRRLLSSPFGHGRLPSPYDCPEGTVVRALLDKKHLVTLNQPRRFNPF